MTTGVSSLVTTHEITNIYSRKLNVNIIEADKLLAMVIYKNLFPKDYIKTQFKQGEVSAVIEKTKEENPTSNWKEILEGNCISKVLDELKNDTELKKNPYYTAIRFLLIQGYIDENYQDYIVYTNGSRRGSNRAQEILKNILAYIDISNEEEIYECYCFYSEESSDYANVGNIIKYLLDKQAIYKSILDRILNEKISKEDYSFIANTLKYIGNYNNYVLYIYECLKENWDSMVSFMDTEDMITNITIIGVYFRSFLPKQLCGDTKTTFVNNSKSLNLKMANLEKADLSSIRLAWAHLEDAHLEGAHLEGAHLGGANLEGANLKGAHLEEVHLEAANLEGANLEDTNLEGAHLGGAHLKRANLKKANLKRANLEDTNLEDTNLEGAHLEGANLKGAHLEGANLKGAHLEEVHLEGANLESANLR